MVARLILKKAGNQKPLRRLWISSVTDKAIKEGFTNLKDGKDYEPLYDAAICRAEADWLVGINATRALTCKYNAQLSCGRVQTPTLAMIAKREEQIKKFVPKPYYGICAKAQGFILVWQPAKSNIQTITDKELESQKPEKTVIQGSWMFDKKQVEIVLGQVKGKEGEIVQIKRTPKKTMPPLLYDLTELQREASRRYDYSAKETLTIMQRLYENHKVLTYPRTDSRYITSDIVPTLKERLRACSVGPYRPLAGKLVNQPLLTKPAFVDNKKVSDHHAIIPTEQFVQLEHMSIDERRIYDLVVRRFLAVMYPPYEYEQTSLTVKIGEELFTAHGNAVKHVGWKAVYASESFRSQKAENDRYEDTEGLNEEGIWNHGSKESEDISLILSRLKEGDLLKELSFAMTEGKTKAPSHFTEDTLLSAMENPVTYMESGNKAMAKTLGETGGLGTVATRADIIEKLFSSFLLEKKGKEIWLTSKAKQLLELVPEDLKKPEMTADWEMKLSKIAEGTLKREVFMRDIREYSQELTKQIKTGEGSFRHENLTNHKCPECGKRLLLVKGKNSEMLVCQDRECGYRETISHTSNARCPNCHKKMELKGKGESQIFVCKCGYKERLKAFQERRKKEGAGVSKKEVAKYLNQQKKESAEPLNNAFAQALAGIQIKD